MFSIVILGCSTRYCFTIETTCVRPPKSRLPLRWLRPFHPVARYQRRSSQSRRHFKKGGLKVAPSYFRRAAVSQATTFAVESVPVAPVTPHDLRRTFSTRSAAVGVTKEDRDACMNHKPTDVGNRHYNLYDRLPEKRAAVDLWSKQLQAIPKRGRK
jgi:integrase